MPTKSKKILIIGAGPGGLAAAMLLAKRGFDVEVFEKKAVVGGRNACLEEKGYRFDMGPTFLQMKFLLDQVFDEAGTQSDKHLQFAQLDPMYELRMGDKQFKPSSNHEKTKAQIEKYYPGKDIDSICS
ncbi:MAG: NAD(P)-binding protein [Bdellovibrionota bacterium]